MSITWELLCFFRNYKPFQEVDTFETKLHMGVGGRQI